jgi:signal transduction histidine kinase
MLIAGVAALDPREVKREIALHHALFNRAQTMISVGLASWALGPFRSELLGADLETALGIALGASINTASNLGLVAIWIHLRQNVSVREALRSLIPKPATGFWVTYALLAGLGAATAIVYRSTQLGAWAVAAFLIPLLFARISIQGARAQQDLSEKIRRQQEALLEATEKVFHEREDERKRIAAQIHDSSLQLLAAASYGTANAQALFQTGETEDANALMATSKQAIDDAIMSLRGSLTDLRRSTIEEGGLMPTIQKFVDQASTLWGASIRIDGEVRSEPPLPVALAAFQILQEGLTNSLKHAQTSDIAVRISEEDGMVHIVVEDDGPGFDPEVEVGSEHVGMRLMRERAERVGGRVNVDSNPGAGTRLEAILPGGVAR